MADERTPLYLRRRRENLGVVAMRLGISEISE